MHKGNHVTCSQFEISVTEGRASGRRRPFAGIIRYDGSGLIRLALIGVVLFAAAAPTFAQITVEPMKMEVQVTPGKIIPQVVNIRNIMPDRTYPLQFSLVELSQSEDGQWMVVDPNGINDPNSPSFGFDLSRLSSCKSWIHIDKTTATLAPLQLLPLEVVLRVPRGMRGFYTAAILVTMKGQQSAPGVGMTLNVEILVPVIIEIEGRTVTPRVDATDVGMEFIPGGGAGPAATRVSMRIENTGATFSRLVPIVRVWSMSGGYWRVITTKEFGDHGIIPGAKITLKQDLNKSLPSGKYRLAAELYVDGRRSKRFQKEIDFTGDPRITAITADRPLDVDPLDITIESLPGTTRAGTIKITNGADATVHVRTALGLPPGLRQISSGELKGEDLDCSGWLKVSPDQFTLQGEGGRQNIQIISTMPNPVATHPCYYALLALWATYPDGQQAGVTTMPICIRNTNIPAQAEAVGLKINIQELGSSKFLVAATFGNSNIIHFAPITVRAGVIPSTDNSGIPRASAYLSGNPSLWLPFEMRQFSGVLDFSILPADTYLLVGRLEYAPNQFARINKLIQVSVEGNERMVRTVMTGQEMGEKAAVDVKW